MVTPLYLVGANYGYRGAGVVEHEWNWTVKSTQFCVVEGTMVV
jgi:hypothetical protein